MRPSVPSGNQIQSRTLLRLSVAAAVALPDGSLSASELRHIMRARPIGDRTRGEMPGSAGLAVIGVFKLARARCCSRRCHSLSSLFLVCVVLNCDVDVT